ncbi:MAG: hypothetical protein A2107_13005 [Verrucomicrobia bacterium GWF2_62_7]|nr:MAG: hypothetical protein A2107_13005 [Verrucomicrobia bacterium GWF2_62_7]
MAKEIPGALILGNGDLNGILWTHNGKLRFSITKNDVCDGRLDTAKDPDLCKIDVKNRKWTKPGRPSSWFDYRYPCPLICGHVEFSKPSGVAFQSKLDLAHACATLSTNNSPLLEACVLAGRNVVIFKTDFPVSLTPCTAKFIPSAKQGTTEGVEWCLSTVPADEDWPGMSFALAHQVKGTRHVVAVVTSLEAKDPVAAAVALAGSALVDDEARQTAAHEAVWRDFWSKSGVALADAYLESVWYRNLYFLRCFSKPGVPPIGLYMGYKSDEMPWHGCATTNYNFEQCFWPAFAANHAELAEPYDRYIMDYLPRAKWFAQETYGLPGAFYPVNLFTHQIFDPAICKSKNRHMNFILPFTYTAGINGWLAHNVWLTYLHHPNRDYLANSAYPVIKPMAVFYAAFLKQCRKTPEGKAIYGPAYSPEHSGFGVDDTPCDIAWTRFTLKAAIQGAQTLGCDADLVTQWQAALVQVPDYPLNPQEPRVVTWARAQKPLYLYDPPFPYNVPVPILPIFPAGEINWWSSEAEKELFTRTLNTVRTVGYNSSMILAGARARLSLPDAYDWISKTFQTLQMPSGFLMMAENYDPVNGVPKPRKNDTGGNYSEQVAAAGIVSELLMQSVGDIIRVFPAWPKDKDASFTNLRAQGGLLVSAEQRGGQTFKIEITSTVGGKLRLLDPWTNEIIERNTKAGESVSFKPAN